MDTLEPKEKISVDDVVRFCFEKFLDVMKNGEHTEPFEAVRKAIMNEYGFNAEVAQSVCRPPYWVLMDERILEFHCCDNGSYWTLKKNGINAASLARKALGANAGEGDYNYRETMKERINGLLG